LHQILCMRAASIGRVFVPRYRGKSRGDAVVIHSAGGAALDLVRFPAGGTPSGLFLGWTFLRRLRRQRFGGSAVEPAGRTFLGRGRVVRFGGIVVLRCGLIAGGSVGDRLFVGLRGSGGRFAVLGSIGIVGRHSPRVELAAGIRTAVGRG